MIRALFGTVVPVLVTNMPIMRPEVFVQVTTALPLVVHRSHRREVAATERPAVRARWVLAHVTVILADSGSVEFRGPRCPRLTVVWAFQRSLSRVFRSCRHPEKPGNSPAMICYTT